MRVRVSGAGPTVVLLHGWATSGRIMEGIAAELEASYETHVVDLPGHGALVEGRVDLSLNQIIDPVIAYVRQLPSPPIMLGWAMGAVVLLKVGLHADVRAGVCIGTPSGGPDFGPAFEKMASRMARDWPRYVRSSADAIVGDRVSPEMLQFLRETMHQTPLSLAHRTLVEVAACDPTDWVRQSTYPLLFVHGADDKISPVEVSERLAAVARDATLKVYAGIGHAPFLEERTQFLRDLGLFLEELDD